MNYKDNVVSMLDLSTAHLCEKTREWLMNEDTEPITVYEKGDYGWFVVIPSEYQLDRNNKLFTEVPEDLKNVLDYALSIDCLWIMFDCDASTEPKLPVYE